MVVCVFGDHPGSDVLDWRLLDLDLGAFDFVVDVWFLENEEICIDGDCCSVSRFRGFILGKG